MTQLLSLTLTIVGFFSERHGGCSTKWTDPALNRRMKHAAEPLLNSREAAKLAQIPEPTLRLLLRRKELPGYKVGRLWRLDKNELKKWIQTRKRITTQRAQSSEITCLKRFVAIR
jgi:excisionase family DNA binding protein